MPLSDFAWTNEMIETGGFASIRFAIHTKSHAPAAVKFLLDEKRTEPKVVSRFLREISTLIEVNSIVPCRFVRVIDYAVATQPPAPWVAMERCQANLRASATQFTEPIRIATATAEISDALAILHDQFHTSHRDVKPENIFIRTDGTLCLGDLGSRLATDDPSRLTGAKSLYPGTDCYRAPECFRTGAISEAAFCPADVYSLGVVIYELLAGRPPLSPDGSIGTIHFGKLVAETPPALIRELRPDVPAELQDIIHQCLEKQALYRPTARELAALLRGFIRNAAGNKPSQRVFSPRYDDDKIVRCNPNVILPIVQMVGGDGVTSYHSDSTGRQDIIAQSTSRLLQLPADVLSVTDDYIRQKQEEAKITPYRFEDNQQVRIDDFGWTNERRADAVLTPLSIKTSLTNYFATHRTHFCIDTRLADGMSIRRKYGGPHDDFDESQLANPLCVNLSVVTQKDDFIVLAERGRRAAGNPGGRQGEAAVYAPAVSGTADLEKDETVGTYDPWLHGLREGAEEVWGDYPAVRDNIVFFGLAKRSDNFCPFLFGEARLNLTLQGLREAKKTARHPDEIRQLIFVRFTISAVVRAIHGLWSLRILAPTAVYSLYASLLYRFPAKRAEIDQRIGEAYPRGLLELADRLSEVIIE